MNKVWVMGYEVVNEMRYPNCVNDLNHLHEDI